MTTANEAPYLKRIRTLLPSPGVLVLALIPLGFLTLFYFYPLFEIFKLSLFPDGRFAADGLRPLLEKAYYLRVLWFTTWQATLSTLGALAAGAARRLRLRSLPLSGQDHDAGLHNTALCDAHRRCGHRLHRPARLARRAQRDVDEAI